MKLTKQEQKISEMISRGMSDDAIMETLFISKSTIKTHLFNIYKKFGIKRDINSNSCRSQLVAKILQKQIIDAKKKLDVAEQLHAESLKFMQPNINICKKFMEIYQDSTACINCPVELMKVDCKKKKDICLQRIWDLIK